MQKIPEKIGKYYVLGVAGKGNMGIVYTGYDPFSDRDVAIKVCAIDEQADEKSRAMARKLFFNEAYMAGILEHPNILRILDAGEEAERPYIVMEYVHGGRTLLPSCDPERLLPVPRVAEIISTCAKALDYAHRRGVIHRDIKPTNIMLTPEGQLKIADFGIAHRPLDDITHVMGLLGSPRYMSPQQIREDEQLNHQTDLYSLGVVMFLLLTGHPPFPATSLPKLFEQITSEPAPRIRDLRAELPEALESIVQCALEKDLSRRYRSGSELACDLAALFPELEQRDDQPHEEARFDAIRNLRFFNEFSDSELWETVRVGSWEEYAPDETIATEARRDISFFVVVGGDVDIIRDGRRLTTLSTGDCFGEAGYGGDNTLSVEVRAANEVKLLRVNETVMENTSQGCQLRLTRAFLRTLIRRLTQRGTQSASKDQRLQVA